MPSPRENKGKMPSPRENKGKMPSPREDKGKMPSPREDKGTRALATAAGYIVHQSTIVLAQDKPRLYDLFVNAEQMWSKGSV